jgi:hypothetical protein
MARKRVTFEDVAQAAAKILAEGWETVTVASVLRRTGGSNTTILPLLQRWRLEQEQAKPGDEPGVPDLPENVVRAQDDHFLAAETAYDRKMIRHRERQLLIRDGSTTYIDPFHHLKFFVDRQDPPPHPNIPPEVDAWRQVITSGLDVTHPRVRAKYVWAAKEFNRRMAPEGSWVQTIEIAVAKERLSERVLQWIHNKWCGR